MSIIQAAGSGEVGSSGFYKHLLDQSLKFNDDDSPSLSKTYSTAQTNTKKLTISVWVKRGNIGIRSTILYAVSGSAGKLSFQTTDKIYFNAFNTGYNGFESNALFKDTSSWYHIVAQADSDGQTGANVNRVYVNGVELANGKTSVFVPDDTATMLLRNGVTTYIGDDTAGAYHFDGYLAEMNVIDGSVVAPTEFAETKDNIWIPKAYSGSYGTNGFHLTFKDDVVSEGFNTVTYTGTGADNSVSGIGFSPDFVWIKSRTTTADHMLFDTPRGALKILKSNSNAAAITSNSENLKSFDGDGFTYGSEGSGGASGVPYVGWCWEAGGAPTADNSASAGATPTAGSVKIDGSNLGSALGGSIAATRLSADTAKGFSVVTYTGTGSAGTVAHGLGAAPKWIIAKRRNATDNWYVYHTSRGSSAYLTLDSDGVGETSVSYPWNGTDPTNSVFSVSSAASPSSSGTMVAYCWAEVSGYSKFGTYAGTGSSHSVTLGFRPAFLMVKRTNADNEWHIIDSTRQPSNPNDTFLFANTTAVENTGDNAITLTATGFTLESSNGRTNADGGTYIYMAFADTREAAFFKDVSTNGNHFTPVNLDYRDSVPDTPTNNFATLNSLALGADGTLSEGNLKIVYGTSSTRSITTATMGVSSGKWYWEVLPNSDGGEIIGVTSFSNDTGLYPGVAAGSAGYYGDDGSKYVDGSNSSYGASFATDIIGFALDMDAGTLVAYKNNSSQGTLVSSLTGNIFPAIGDGGAGGTSSNTFNFGQDSSFGGLHATANANADGNGHGSFAYAPPSGFLALCSQNLPDVAIIDGTEYFNTVAYTGTGATTLSITGVGFQPDWVWAKKRSATDNHAVADTVRGATKSLFPNTTGVESTDAQGLRSFDSDGFTIGSGSGSGVWGGNSGATYVAWNWLAGGAPTATNSAGAGNAPTSGSVMIDGVASTSALAGTIPATKISANTTAGFSVISYTGNGSSGQTVAHGLSSAPEFIIHKDRDTNSNNNQWNIYHAGAGDKYGYFLVNAFAGSAQIISNGTDTIELKSNLVTSNESGDDFIMYAFHSVEGYSKFGTYTGNNTFNFVYTGFRPAFVILKKITASQTYGWQIYDAKRSPINVALFPGFWADTNAAEAANTYSVNIHSTGFRLTGSGNNQNQNGVEYIYIAIADQPAKFANAR